MPWNDLDTEYMACFRLQVYNYSENYDFRNSYANQQRALKRSLFTCVLNNHMYTAILLV